MLMPMFIIDAELPLKKKIFKKINHSRNGMHCKALTYPKVLTFAMEVNFGSTRM